MSATLKRTQPSIPECLRIMEGFVIKQAELGGDGQDQPFEQAFSNLAHAYLRDKAPSLLDHEMGFQLLDRNQDNTKAIGVFGFKVGSHMLFAPVFFLQGDLKGHELLYIKNQDMFVPMKENWLNYILNRKPNILGDAVSRNSAEMGVMQPDLNRLSKSPWKYASAAPQWVNDVMPKLAHTALTDVSTELDEYAKTINLPRFAKMASLGQLSWLVDTCQRHPRIAQAVVEHHGSLDFIHEGIQRAKSASVLYDKPAQRQQPIIGGSILPDPNEHPIKTGQLKIVTYEATQKSDQPHGLTEEKAEQLLQDGLLIEDNREGDAVSTPYNVQTEQRLWNPQCTGLYEVLVKPGKFERCYVAFHPHGPACRKLFCTVVRVDEGDRNWLNIHPSRVWCSAKIEGEDYDNWYDGLPDPDSLPTSDSYRGGRMMLIGPRGNATLPFRAKKTLGDAYGETSYDVDFSDHCEYGLSDSVLHPTGRDHYQKDYGALDDYDSWRDGQRVHLDGKEGTDLRSSRGDVWIPKGYKLLKVEPSAEDMNRRKQENSDCCMPCDPGGDSRSEPSPIRPGNIIDAELAIMTQLSETDVRARTKDAVEIDGNPYTFNEALIDLVVNKGLREGVARTIIKEAIDKRGKPHKFHIKLASPYEGDPYLTPGAAAAPGFPGPETIGGANMMGYDGATQGPGEYMLPVEGLRAEGNNRAVYDVRPDATGEPMDMDTIQKAMESGQQEIFDTAMIGSMLKAVRDDTMIDRYVPDLVKGMDRLGRILFMFYWHGDTFADRYGKQDMPELEDSLRNAFEMMGDVILFLKQKTIEPYPEEDSVDLDLGAAASV